MTIQAPKQPPTDELVGRVINDRFRIISVIARGGMGRVYRAEQVPLGRMVAIKTLDPRSTGGELDPQFQQRFFLEASVASKLQHPNTVTVFDYGRTADDLYFIAMELVEGRSLLNLVRQEAPLPAARVVHIALQIARSLREAHRLDVIHRDLKPGNVLLARHGDEEDFVKVLDFGLVKHIESEAEQELTKAGLFMGSPKYMAPEQIRGERVDGRGDIYSLGVVMYEMLSGKVPFERENTVKVLMAHMHEPVPPLHVEGCPEALIQLVMRCLAKDAAHRPASMDEVIALLKQASGAHLTASGAFALSQEMRLSQVPGMVATPSQGFGYGMNSISQPLPQAPTDGGPQSVSGVLPHAASLVPPAPASGSSSWLPKVAVVLALGIAGGFLALRFAERGGSLSVPASVASAPVAAPPAPTTAPTASAAPSSTSSAAADPANAATVAAPTDTSVVPPTGGPVAVDQQHVLVRLTSTPSGATVTADGKVYGQTPADIEWWGELATPGRQITFSFEKEGYEKATVVRTVHGEKLNVEALLPPLSGPARRPRPPRDLFEPNKQAPRGPVVVPEDFKEDPY
jgi:eukaryotic-like serine/threonine-protein kinase